MGISHLIVDIEILSQRVTSRHEGAVVFGDHLEDLRAAAAVCVLVKVILSICRCCFGCRVEVAIHSRTAAGCIARSVCGEDVARSERKALLLKKRSKGERGEEVKGR